MKRLFSWVIMSVVFSLSFSAAAQMPPQRLQGPAPIVPLQKKQFRKINPLQPVGMPAKTRPLEPMNRLRPIAGGGHRPAAPAGGRSLDGNLFYGHGGSRAYGTGWSRGGGSYRDPFRR